MKERFTTLIEPVTRRLSTAPLPPTLVARLAPLRDRLAPIVANRALVSGVGLYTLLFVVLLLLFTLFRFPADRLVAGGVAEANRRIAPMTIDYEQVKGKAPLGALLEGVTLSLPAGRLATAETVTLRPALFASLIGRPGVDMTATMAGGSVDIDLRNHGYRQGAPVSVSFTIDDVDTGAIEGLAQSPWAKVAGTVSGDGSFDADPTDGTTLEGRVALLLRSVSLTLSQALFPDAPPIRIDEISVKLTAGDKKIVVTTGSVKGPEVQATVSGDIALAKKIDFSRLNLTINAQLSGDLKNRIGPFLAMIPGAAGGDGSQIKLALVGTLSRPVMK